MQKSGMENYKIFKFLNNSTVSNFVARKWIEVNDLSGGQYSFNKNIRFKTPVLRSDLWDYSDVFYIILKGTIYLVADGNNDMTQKGVVFNAPFRLCIPKINNKFIENAEDQFLCQCITYYNKVTIFL